jgi:hypothetical protein
MLDQKQMPDVFRKQTVKTTANKPELSNKAAGSGSSGCPTILSSSSCSALLPCDELLWKRTYILSYGTFHLFLTAGSPLTLRTMPKSGQCVKQLHIWNGKTLLLPAPQTKSQGSSAQQACTGLENWVITVSFLAGARDFSFPLKWPYRSQTLCSLQFNV